MNLLAIISSCALLLSFPLTVFYLIDKSHIGKELKFFIVVLTPLLITLTGLPFKIIGELSLFAKGITIISLFVSLICIGNNFKQIPIFLKSRYLDLIFLILISAIYMKDAFTHISIGYVDSLSSYGFILRFLDSTPENYQPGYAIYAAPLVEMYNFENDLNYLGSIVGLSFISYIMFLLNSFRKNFGYIFIIFLVLPFFIEVNKTFIGVTTSSMSFYALVATLVGIIRYILSTEKYKIFYLTPLIMSWIITPVLGYYLIIIVTSIFLIQLVFSRQNIFSQIRILTVGYLSVLLYFANSVLSELFYYRRLELTNVRTIPELLTSASGVIGYVQIGMWESGKSSNNKVSSGFFDYASLLMSEMFSTSNKLRVLSSYMDFGAYFALIMVLIVFIIAVKRSNIEYRILCIAAIIFGASLCFGIFEFSYIKGRSGWYYLLSINLIASILITRLNSFVFDKILVLVFILSSLTNLVSYPVIHYRYHNEEIFFYLREKLSTDFQGDIFIYSDLPNLSSINLDNAKYLPTKSLLDIEFSQNDGETDVYMAVLDFNYDLVDPILSRKYHYAVTSSTGLASELTLERNLKIANSSMLEDFLLSQEFTKSDEVGNFKVYVYSKRNSNRAENK